MGFSGTGAGPAINSGEELGDTASPTAWYQSKIFHHTEMELMVQPAVLGAFGLSFTPKRATVHMTNIPATLEHHADRVLRGHLGLRRGAYDIKILVNVIII